jgi:hypothetical protein
MVDHLDVVLPLQEGLVQVVEHHKGLQVTSDFRQKSKGLFVSSGVLLDSGRHLHHQSVQVAISAGTHCFSLIVHQEVSLIFRPPADEPIVTRHIRSLHKNFMRLRKLRIDCCEQTSQSFSKGIFRIFQIDCMISEVNCHICLVQNSVNFFIRLAVILATLNTQTYLPLHRRIETAMHSHILMTLRQNSLVLGQTVQLFQGSLRERVGFSHIVEIVGIARFDFGRKSVSVRICLAIIFASVDEPSPSAVNRLVQDMSRRL